MHTTSHPRSTPRALAAAALAAAVFAGPLTHSARAQGRWGQGPWGRRGQGNGQSDGTYDGGNDRGGYGRGGNGARALYQWSGRVDREAYVVMQSGDVRTQIDGYDNRAGGRVRVRSELPQADGVIDVRLAEGRGRVDVTEQPSRRNGYRAVVRVRDDDAGAGDYRFVATWRPTGGYAGGYGDGRSDDGRYGDGRDRDRDRDRRDRGDRDRDGRDRDGRYGGRDGNGSNGTYGNGNGTYDNGTYGGSGVLHWRGRVDDVAEIRLQGGHTDTRTVSGQGIAGVRSQIAGSALPARDVTVRVNDRSGRGRVSVVQQPHAWNGYTAVVRVEDHDAGADWYDLDVSW